MSKKNLIEKGVSRRFVYVLSLGASVGKDDKLKKIHYPLRGMVVFHDAQKNEHVCLLDKYDHIRELPSELITKAGLQGLTELEEFVKANMLPGKMKKNLYRDGVYWLSIRTEEKPEKK